MIDTAVDDTSKEKSLDELPCVHLDNDAHVAATGFRETATFAAGFCLRSMDLLIKAFHIASCESVRRQEEIIAKAGTVTEEAVEAFDSENRTGAFFEGVGLESQLGGLVIQGYSTVETISTRAVGILKKHLGLAFPKKGNRESKLHANVRGIDGVLATRILPDVEDSVIVAFAKVRNLLVHQGLFIDADDSEVEILRQNEWHGDFFEMPGEGNHNLILREHGVRAFLRLSQTISIKIADAVFGAIVGSGTNGSTEAPGQP